eukprot:1597343-Amphidinium_carterae.1
MAAEDLSQPAWILLILRWIAASHYCLFRFLSVGTTCVRCRHPWSGCSCSQCASGCACLKGAYPFHQVACFHS